jgi:hypothetical protein
MRDGGTALLVFLLRGLVEEAGGSFAQWLGQQADRGALRCWSSGVPWMGLAFAVFVPWLAVSYSHLSWNERKRPIFHKSY